MLSKIKNVRVTWIEDFMLFYYRSVVSTHKVENRGSVFKCKLHCTEGDGVPFDIEIRRKAGSYSLLFEDEPGEEKIWRLREYVSKVETILCYESKQAVVYVHLC